VNPDAASISDRIFKTITVRPSDTILAHDDIKTIGEFRVRVLVSIQDVIRATKITPVFDAARVDDRILKMVTYGLSDEVAAHDDIKTIGEFRMRAGASIQDILRATLIKFVKTVLQLMIE
jgi:hypothetical protein